MSANINNWSVPRRPVLAHLRFWAFAHAVPTTRHAPPPDLLSNSPIILQPQASFPKSSSSHLLPGSTYHAMFSCLFAFLSLHYTGGTFHTLHLYIHDAHQRIWPPPQEAPSKCLLNEYLCFNTLSHGFLVSTSESLSWFSSSWTNSWLTLLCNLGKVTFPLWVFGSFICRIKSLDMIEKKGPAKFHFLILDPWH